MAESNNIRVSVRVRPLSLKEIEEGDSNCLTLSDHSTTISAGEKWVVARSCCWYSRPLLFTSQLQIMKWTISSRYKFDNAFPPPADQEELFEGTAKPLVDDVFKVGFAWLPVSYPYSIKCLFVPFGQGYNVTVMAYGQTGSGKTYTMGTSDTALSQDIKIHGWIYIFASHTSSYYCDCRLLFLFADTNHLAQHCAAVYVKHIRTCQRIWQQTEGNISTIALVDMNSSTSAKDWADFFP